MCVSRFFASPPHACLQFKPKLFEYRVKALEELESKARLNYQAVTPKELGLAIENALAAGLGSKSYTYASAGETMLWLEEMHEEMRQLDSPAKEEVLTSFKERAAKTGAFLNARSESDLKSKLGSMQALIRMRLSVKKFKRRKVEVQLQAQLLKRKADRDLDQLQEDIMHVSRVVSCLACHSIVIGFCPTIVLSPFVVHLLFSYILVLSIYRYCCLPGDNQNAKLEMQSLSVYGPNHPAYRYPHAATNPVCTLRCLNS